MLSRTPAAPSAAFGAESPRSYGILTSFPPTACGIATFSAALATGLIDNGATVNIVRCGTPPASENPLVRAFLDDDAPPARVRNAIEVLNANDVVILQHEYGLYDGPDGEAAVAILEAVEVPSIVVAHTVLTAPTYNQRIVLEKLCRAADTIVVMTSTAQSRLIEGFDVDAEKVVVVPHGAATPLADSTPGLARQEGRAPRLLTWGLLGPGKGIEWALDAVGGLVDLEPRPEYLIAGATHPKVLAHSGEAYREMLMARAERSGAESMVTFDDSYRDVEALTELIHSADLVVLPYDSEDQVTSGVLVDAVAAGRPVVSTAFPHAVELLGSGAGLVVPQRDADALGSAIRAVLTDSALAARMAAEARRLAPDLSWTAVAGQYDEIGRRLVAGDHLVST